MYVLNNNILKEVRESFRTTLQTIIDHQIRHDEAEACRYASVSLDTYLKAITNFEMGANGCKSHLSLPQYRYRAIGAILGYKQYLLNSPSGVKSPNIDELILKQLKKRIDEEEMHNQTSQDRKDELFIEAILKGKHSDQWMDISAVFQIIFAGEISYV